MSQAETSSPERRVGSDPAAEPTIAGAAIEVWLPSKPELTLFMRSLVTCRVCIMAREAEGLRPSIDIHVRLDGDVLVVTEVPDLHEPGFSLCARRVWEGTDRAIFSLLEEAPSGVRLPLFRAGLGFVRVWLHHGIWRMTIVGDAKGLTSKDGCAFEAAEISR